MRTLLFNFENVDVVYKDLQALRQINLQITSGEKIILVGPSGAGKTSLLHKLYQMRPDECAFIHQHHPLMPQLSVFHNVYMGGLNCHTTLSNLLNLVKPQKKMIAEVLPVIRSIGMEEKMFVRVEQLTREQKQRVAIGQAIYRNSPILLADEPTASLDPLCVDSILKLIINTDKTVIMVLHSVELTLKFAQRIIGICAGTIQFDLPIDQVTSDNITDLYISDGLP